MTPRLGRLAAAAVSAAARSRGAVAKLVLALFTLFALPSLALQKGDIDLDCDVDLADVLLLQRALDGQYTLTGDAEENADVAPWDDVALEPVPNSVVDRGDLVVLYRAVAEGWDLPSDRPELTGPSATSEMNPITVHFDVPVPNGVDATIAFTVNGRLQPDTVDATGGPDGTASGFLDLVVLFDGANEITATSTVAGGSTSCPGVPVTVTYNNVEPRSIGGDLKVPLALTPGDPPVEYNVEQDFNILANPFADPPENGILILQPGVRLLFQDGTRIRLDDQESELRIQGEPGFENRVVLTSGQAATRGAWQGISGQTNAAITIDHAVIDYAANPIRANGPSSISNTEIRHFTGTGITAAPPAALRYLVIDNRDDPTLPPAPGELFGTGIEMGGNGTLTLEDSEIRGTQLAVSVNRANANAVVIAGNIIEYNGTGIRAASTFSSSSKPLIEFNQIRHHATTGIVARGSAGPPANPTIRFNRIHDNSTNLDTRSNPNPGVIIDARYNWWGVATPPSIAASIVDQLDPPSSDTLVDYVPFYEDSGFTQIDPTWLYLRVDEASTPTPSFAYEALGPLIVDPGTTWAIPEGATIAMPALATPLADVSVAGTLIVNGQAGSGNEVAFVAGGSDPQPGEWGGIHLTSSGLGSQLSYLRIRHATSSVSATGTDISIANADIGLFTESGVLFDGVTDDSQIVGSVIDGTLDPVSNPSVTVKDNATANVFGIQIIDSYGGCMPGSCGEISGNQLTNLVTGLHVIGDSDPLIIDNEINENIWGIWLQGTDDGVATAAPLPLIRDNRIFGNAATAQELPQSPGVVPRLRFCSLIAGANLCLSDYASAEAVTLVDATENYWGVGINDPDAVRESILVTEGQRTAVDVSRFTNLDGTVTLGGSSGIFSALAVDIKRSSTGNNFINAVLRPAPPSSEQLDISFFLVEEADVKLEIFDENDIGGTVRHSEGPMPLAQGPQTLTWDGTSGGEFVPDGAYAFVLTTTGSVVTDTYDPPRNTGSLGSGDSASGDSVNTAVDQEFNSFEGDYLTAGYVLKESPPRGVPFASRVSARVTKRPDGNPDNCDADSALGKLVARPWVDEPLWLEPSTGEDPPSASYEFLWDGRVDSFGADMGNPDAIQLPEGTIVAGDPASGFDDFCVFFEVPQPLKPSHVIVDGTLPVIRGTTAPQVKVLADPFLFDPTYEQVARMPFTVDRDADVRVLILPPGEIDLGSAIVTMDLGTVTANQPVEPEWNAIDPDPMKDSNDLETSIDGPYTFAIEATTAGTTNLTSVYRGVVQVTGTD